MKSTFLCMHICLTLFLLTTSNPRPMLLSAIFAFSQFLSHLLSSIIAIFDIYLYARMNPFFPVDWNIIDYAWHSFSMLLLLIPLASVFFRHVDCFLLFFWPVSHLLHPSGCFVLNVLWVFVLNVVNFWVTFCMSGVL